MRFHFLSTSLATAALGLFGVLDYFTGPDFGFSLFYIVPIALMGWRAGVVPACFVAAVATSCWMGADLPYRDADHIPVALWNGFTRFAIYFFVAIAVARLRAGRDAQGMLSERLTQLLGEAERSARTDPLTGLANSRAFLEEVTATIERERRRGGPVSMAYVDLDHFKQVNDKFGHSGGDAALKRVATELRSALRAVDVPARLGGDEFALLLFDADRPGAETVARRIIARVQEVALDYPGTGLGASVGLVHFARAPADADTLVRAADQAMYRAKSAGKGTVVIFDADDVVAEAPAVAAAV